MHRNKTRAVLQVVRSPMTYDDGEIVFRHACQMGLEGIVSNRKDSPYRSGRSPDCLKMKNPACEAVRREAEEDWGR
jgi:ATP-dependent DNA ligase